MSLYQHIIADWAISQNAAIKAALAIDPKTIGSRTSAEAEVSRMAVDLIRKMHALPELVDRLGPSAVFRPRANPLTPEERKAASL